jgi:hypothetical protein
MPVANSYFLSYLVGPLNTVSDDEANTVQSGDDAVSIRKLISQYVCPGFDLLADQSQEDCKNALRYFLTTKTAPFESILDDQQEWPIESPSEPSLFFIWIWDELFPGQDYRLENLEQWEVCKDHMRLKFRNR